MKNIAVIGSGTMGNGIAHTFAQFGYLVNLLDINEKALQKAISTITKNLDRQIQKGIIFRLVDLNLLLSHLTRNSLSLAALSYLSTPHS